MATSKINLSLEYLKELLDREDVNTASCGVLRKRWNQNEKKIFESFKPDELPLFTIGLKEEQLKEEIDHIIPLNIAMQVFVGCYTVAPLVIALDLLSEFRTILNHPDNVKKIPRYFNNARNVTNEDRNKLIKRFKSAIVVYNEENEKLFAKIQQLVESKGKIITKKDSIKYCKVFGVEHNKNQEKEELHNLVSAHLGDNKKKIALFSQFGSEEKTALFLARYYEAMHDNITKTLQKIKKSEKLGAQLSSQLKDSLKEVQVLK